MPDPLAELDQMHQRLSRLATAEPRRQLRGAYQTAAARVLDALELLRRPDAPPEPPRPVATIVTPRKPARG